MELSTTRYHHNPNLRLRAFLFLLFCSYSKALAQILGGGGEEVERQAQGPSFFFNSSISNKNTYNLDSITQEEYLNALVSISDLILSGHKINTDQALMRDKIIRVHDHTSVDSTTITDAMLQLLQEHIDRRIADITNQLIGYGSIHTDISPLSYLDTNRFTGALEDAIPDISSGIFKDYIDLCAYLKLPATITIQQLRYITETRTGNAIVTIIHESERDLCDTYVSLRCQDQLQFEMPQLLPEGERDNPNIGNNDIGLMKSRMAIMNQMNINTYLEKSIISYYYQYLATFYRYQLYHSCNSTYPQNFFSDLLALSPQTTNRTDKKQEQLIIEQVLRDALRNIYRQEENHDQSTTTRTLPKSHKDYKTLQLYYYTYVADNINPTLTFEDYCAWLFQE